MSNFVAHRVQGLAFLPLLKAQTPPGQSKPPPTMRSGLDYFPSPGQHRQPGTTWSHGVLRSSVCDALIVACGFPKQTFSSFSPSRRHVTSLWCQVMSSFSRTITKTKKKAMTYYFVKVMHSSLVYLQTRSMP